MTFNKMEQKRSVLLPAYSGVWDGLSLPPSNSCGIRKHSDAAKINIFSVISNFSATFFMETAGDWKKLRKFAACSSEHDILFAHSRLELVPQM